MTQHYQDNQGGWHELDDVAYEYLLTQNHPSLTFISKTQAEYDAAHAPVPPTLDQSKTTQLATINAAADKAFSAITASYPKQEVDTWPNQYAEAQAYTANATAPTPTLSAIATAIGSTVSIVAASVLQKASAYTTASGAVVGRRKLLTAQIQAATDVTTVQGVTW